MGGVQSISYREEAEEHRLHYCPEHSASNLTGLKLLLPVEETQYILTARAKGNKLRGTGISIRTDIKGNPFIEDADVRSFLRAELQNEDLRIFSYWKI